MHIVILEDEPLAARQLQTMIAECDPGLQVLGVLPSVEEAVLWFRMHQPPDLILADIELLDGQSFDIFDQVEVKSPVIFTTAYDEYALRAFRVNSVDYLLKPLDEEALRQSLAKFAGLKKLFGNTATGIDLKALANLLRETSPQPPAYRDRFLLKMGDRLVPVELRQIAYFYTKDRLTLVRTWENRSYTLDFTLDELEMLLDPKLFFRANRQLIVCAKAVDKIHLHFHSRLKLELQPVTEEEVYVSREKAPAFRQWMGE